LKMDTSSESLSLLQLIANEGYRTEQFVWAAKAFDVLERLDPTTAEHWEGKRGACVGAFRQAYRGLESKSNLAEVMALLRSSTNPQADYIHRIMRRWCSTAA
jgi:intraflagellar transport protein 56